MPGFVGYVSTKIKTDVELYMQNILDLEFDEIQDNHYSIRYYSNKKFDKDKIFQEDNDVIIGFDGYLLSSKKLKVLHKTENSFILLKKLFYEKGIHFVKELRGSFSGFLYDKKEDLWYVFTDHLSTKTLFFFRDNKRLIFSSSLKSIAQVLNQLGCGTTLSELGAYYLLTYGFMLGNETLINEIKKIPGGTILIYGCQKISFSTYYQLDNTKYINDKKNQIIENLDHLFTEAVKLEYEKDREYDYSHVSTLSGGLDTRMNVSYAAKNGYRDIQVFCFSQKNYLDEIISREIAEHFGFYYRFYPLDGGNYLKVIDDPIIANDGLIFYAGAGHELAAIKSLELNEKGMIHTGQIGDLVLGSYLKNHIHQPVSDSILKHSSYSKKLLDRIPSHIWKDLKEKYANGELFSFYERCINGAYNGNFMGYQFTEVSTPFLYLDFFEYSMNIHPELRYLRKIYLEWIAKKNKDMANFNWEYWNRKPNLLNFRFRIFHRTLNRIKKKMEKKLGKNTYTMDPVDYWYKTNNSLPEFFITTFNDNKDTLNAFPELKKDTQSLFNNGTVFEKTQALTLTKALRFLF